MAWHHGSAHGAAPGPGSGPCLDVFGPQLYVTTSVPHLLPHTRQLQVAQLDLFVGRNFLVSAHKQPLPFAARLQTRAQQSPDLPHLDAAFMLYLVLDELLTYYDELSEHAEDEIEAMEECALRATGETFLAELLAVKRYIFTLSVWFGRGAVVRHAILDKNVQVAPGAAIGVHPELDRARFTVSSSGVVVVAKNQVVPAGLG